MVSAPRGLRALAMLGMATMLNGCGAAAPERRELVGLRETVKKQQAEIRRLNLEVQIEQAHVAALQNVAASTSDLTQLTGPENLADPEAPEPEPVAMCYKDYCPCEPPQGGPDTVLCDQLEEGIKPDTELMIAGRGMREGRRQIAESDF